MPTIIGGTLPGCPRSLRLWLRVQEKQKSRTKFPQWLGSEQWSIEKWKHVCVKAAKELLRSPVLYCIVSMHLYSASCSAHQSEARPVWEIQREESSLERTKRGNDRGRVIPIMFRWRKWPTDLQISFAVEISRRNVTVAVCFTWRQ